MSKFVAVTTMNTCMLLSFVPSIQSRYIEHGPTATLAIYLQLAALMFLMSDHIETYMEVASICLILLNISNLMFPAYPLCTSDASRQIPVPS